MRKLLAVLGAMLMLSVSAIGAMAQDATPAAGTATATGAIDPAIGDTVVYLDAAGNPAANVTIDNVQRGWADYGEFDEPSVGVEYIAFTVTVESVTASGAIEVSDFDFTLQDANGYLWGTSFADAAEGAEITPLDDDVLLASGESTTFLVVFEVVAGTPLAHLFWQPDSGRLITLAGLDGI
jgi:hypothetical protein